MKVGFIFTNYNNSILSVQLAQSIAASHGECQYEIIFVDNNSIESERIILGEPGALPSHCSVIWNSVNVGYFDGLNIGISEFLGREVHYDAIIIGNNDLIFDDTFFSALKNEQIILDTYRVISPDILTLDGIHQNPHVISNIGRFREFVWDLYYSNYIISRIVNLLAIVLRRFTARKDFIQHGREGLIAQGYGACYIMTPGFFEKYGKLWSPGFLMGEEFYLERQLYGGGDRMYYTPKFKVVHFDHATVSKLQSRRLWEMSRQYHRIYRFFISPYRLLMDNGKTSSDFDSSAKAKNTNDHS